MIVAVFRKSYSVLLDFSQGVLCPVLKYIIEFVVVKLA